MGTERRGRERVKREEGGGRERSDGEVTGKGTNVKGKSMKIGKEGRKGRNGR